jgi:hypothetical protein
MWPLLFWPDSFSAFWDVTGSDTADTTTIGFEISLVVSAAATFLKGMPLWLWTNQENDFVRLSE